ncbi:hypothetical protein C8F01DRAFT_1183216 [Mycena amicta]|nr:hypothetical protein C8F01DRAFT_1183216 [Mycena amicta]
MEDEHGWQQYPSSASPSPYTCIDCSATFSLNYSLRQHMQSMHGWQQGPSFPLTELACVDCAATFGDKSSLRVHMENVHSRFQDYPSPDMFAHEMLKCTMDGCATLCPGRKAYEDHKRSVHGYGMWEQTMAAMAAPVGASWSGYNGSNNASAFPGFTSTNANANTIAPAGAPYVYNPSFGSIPQSNSTASPWSSFANNASVKPNPTSNSGTLYPSPYSSVPAYPGTPWPTYHTAAPSWSQAQAIPGFKHIAGLTPFYSPPSTPTLPFPQLKIPTVPSIPIPQAPPELVPPRTCAYFNCGRTFSSDEALSMHLRVAHDGMAANLNNNHGLTDAEEQAFVDAWYQQAAFENRHGKGQPPRRPLSCVSKEKLWASEADEDPAELEREAAQRLAASMPPSGSTSMPKLQEQANAQSPAQRK